MNLKNQLTKKGIKILIMKIFILIIISDNVSAYSKSAWNELFNQKNNTAELNNNNPNNANDPYFHLYKILNLFYSFALVWYYTFNFILDVFLIPYHLIVFLINSGIFNILKNSISYGIYYPAKNLIISNELYFVFSQLLNLLESLLYTLPKFIYNIYVFLNYTSKVLLYIINGMNYICSNFSGKFNSLFFDIEVKKEDDNYFLLKLFNPVYVIYEFPILFTALIFVFEIKFIMYLYPIIKRIISYISYFVNRYLTRGNLIDLYLLYGNNCENIFDSNNFYETKITQQTCAICLDDYCSEENYSIIDYKEIKEKVKQILSRNIENFNNVFNKKFDADKKLIKLDCQHFYHGECFKDLIYITNRAVVLNLKCPICRFIT